MSQSPASLLRWAVSSPLWWVLCSDPCVALFLLVHMFLEGAAGLGPDPSTAPNASPSPLVPEHEQLPEAVVTPWAPSRGHRRCRRRRQLLIPPPFPKLAYKLVPPGCGEADPRLAPLTLPVHPQNPALLRGERCRRAEEEPGSPLGSPPALQAAAFALLSSILLGRSEL